jgi:hypothetical protein
MLSTTRPRTEIASRDAAHVGRADGTPSGERRPEVLRFPVEHLPIREPVRPAEDDCSS